MPIQHGIATATTTGNTAVVYLGAERLLIHPSGN
jgi:hypothetical protein